MDIRTVSLATLAMATSMTFAQDYEMAAGRPGESYSPFTVGNKKLQFESGFDFDFHEGLDNITINYSTLKMGLGDNAEAWIDLAEAYNNSCSQGGISTFDLGFKYRFFDGNDNMPAIGALGIVTPPIGMSSTRPDNVGIFVDILAENQIGNFDYILNVGYDFDGTPDNGSTFLSLFVDYNINDKLYIFAENYNYLRSGANSCYGNAGLGYMLRDNLQLDLSSYHGLGKNSPSWGLSAGFVWTIK